MRAVQRHTESPESGAPSAETAPVQRRASPRGHDYATAVQRLAPVQLREDRASVQGKSAEDLNGGPTFGGVGKPTQQKAAGVVSGVAIQRKESRQIQRKLDEKKIAKGLASADAKRLLGRILDIAIQAKSAYDTAKSKKEQLETIIAAIEALQTPSETAGDDVRRFQAFYKAVSLALPKVPVVSDFNDMMIEGLASVAVAFDTIFAKRDQNQKEAGIGMSLYQQTGERTALMLWATNIGGYHKPADVKPTSSMIKGWLRSKQGILAAATGVDAGLTGIEHSDNARSQGFGAYRNWVFIHRSRIVRFVETLTGRLS